MFKGVGTALITPFDSQGGVDYGALRRICIMQVEAGIDALIVLGTTGESPVIDIDERRKIIETVSEEAGGKTKIIVGTGTNDTKDVVLLNKIAEEYKTDGVLVVNPYYNKGTQESLVEHYKYISERTSLPIMLYNVPSRTGMNLLPDTAIRIHSECRNITSIKEASGSISQIAELISKKPGTLAVFSGNDDQTLPIMALGGDGIISVFSNAYPKLMKNLTNAVFQNDMEAARKFNNAYLGMMNALFVETSPMPLKYVMNKLGLCENIFRLPLIPVTGKSRAVLDKEMSIISELNN